MVQWLGLHTVTAEGMGSIPGQGTKILQAVQCGQNKQTNKVFKLLAHFKKLGGFPGGTVVGNPPADAGDTGLSPGLGRSHMPWSS